MPLLTAGPSRFLGGGNVTWLLRDEFTTDLAAGSVNGTAAEPGPGTRTLTSNVSGIASGIFNIPASTGDCARYDDVIFATRTAGRMLLFRKTFSSGTNEQGGFGWHNAATAVSTRTGSFGASAGTNSDLAFTSAGGAHTVLDVALNEIYDIALIVRAAGGFMFTKLSAGLWRLLWRDERDTTTSLRAAIGARNGADCSQVIAHVRIPDALWLPTPLVSDGFATTFGTSDGLGHAEGIATGIGAGGGGVAWTQQVGTWTVGSAKANAATLDGGIAVATAPATTANVVLGVACVRSAGDVGVVLSWSDSSNYVRALHNGTNVQLIKTVAGAPTTLINAAATYSAGARLVVIKDETKYRVYYNNALVGTEQTIADAGIISNTLHGLFSTDVGNTLDDFVVYARGNEGQYANLDRYSGS